MKNTPYEILLLRHAESIKNIKHIHGGLGEELTQLGVEQALRVAQSLIDYGFSNLKIFSSNSYHTLATAQIIGKELDKIIEQPIQFKPLYLGIADGISDEELKILDINSYSLFKRWREKKIDIKELLIPNMESYIDFWDRGLSLINSIAFEGDSLLVCSNSLMILLTHIMMNNNPKTTDNYRHIDIGNCEIIAFKTFDYQKYEFDNKLTTVKDVFNVF